MLSLVPVKKLSTHSTSWPSARRRSQRWEPRKPAPPVTRMRLRRKSVAKCKGEAGSCKFQIASEKVQPAGCNLPGMVGVLLGGGALCAATGGKFQVTSCKFQAGSSRPQVTRDGWGISGGRGARRRGFLKLMKSCRPAERASHKGTKSQATSCKLQVPSHKRQVPSRKFQVASCKGWLGCPLWEGRCAPGRKKVASLKSQVPSGKIQVARNGSGTPPCGRGARRRDFFPGLVAPRSGPPTGMPSGMEGLVSGTLPPYRDRDGTGREAVGLGLFG